MSYNYIVLICKEENSMITYTLTCLIIVRTLVFKIHSRVIIKIHTLFPVHLLVTSNIFVPVLLQPISFSYITMTSLHNMQSGKPSWKKIFLDMQHPLIPFSPWCYQHKIILFRKMKNIFYVKSGYIHNIQGNYA